MSDPLAFLDDEIAELRERGLFRWPRELQGEQAPVCMYDGRRVINLCSNNYLGLASDPRLKEAARRAIDEYGVGSGAVRTIAGNMTIPQALERRLATFKRAEAALLFQSGFTANAGTVAALLGKEDVVVSDELNHASIIDGCRLSGAERKVFPHKDIAAARRCLETSRTARRVLVITDGVFSMDGDLARLADLAALAREFGAIMMVDDAHASGVVGAGGRGTVEHFHLHGMVDIQVGLRDLGYDTGLSETPITPVMIGDEAQAMRFSDRLFEEGVFALGIAYPTVPRGKARVRTIVTAGHTRDDLSRALDVLGRVG